MALLPEKNLSLSPQLAATLGLEEALLYQLLGDFQAFAANQASELRISCDQLLSMVPFWQAEDIQRISTSLQDKGVLSVTLPFGSTNSFRFTMADSAITAKNQEHQASPRPARTLQPTAPRSSVTQLNTGSGRGFKTISNQWQPAADVVAQLQQYGIPKAFIFQQVAEFVTYWAERGDPRHSWNAKFLKQVLRVWRDEEAKTHKRSLQSPMNQDWQPSPDAVEILNRQAAIHLNFIEDAIPEFVLYWRERGESRSTWNTDFVRHVKNQWARFTATLEHDRTPKVISRTWQPSEDVFEVLKLANIPKDFAVKQLPEFVLFWHDNGQAHSSWNTKFLQQVKRQWARHSSESNRHHDSHQKDSQSIPTRGRSLVEDLTDRSWAN